ncbi:Gfo/Idh/MocA family protein [Mesobacillus harenae]|uniref:Gfo/Idh/MocA family protein n=1 Tax=Mesobacillus harenae TaxID=2213203 RepID=UPI0015806B98|nr:Gfo/Idh/MocA family oxidoreductase [Mesobacillus harenae]
MLRVGQIGGGIMGKQHMAVFDQYHRSEIIALSTADHEPGKKLSKQFDVDYYEEYQSLLEREDIDMVCIATPDFTHFPIVMDALKAGKHVVVEKPLTMKVGESREIVEFSKKQNLKVMTLFNHRWIPSYAQTKQLLEKNQFSPIVGYARKNDRISVPTELIKWSNHTSSAYFLSSHDIDLMNWFFDSQVEEVYATAVNRVLKSKGINTPDAIQIQAKYKNGAIATFESCWIYPNTYPSVTDSFLEIVTEEEIFHLKRESEQLEYGNNDVFIYPRNQLNVEMTGRLRGSLVYANEHFVDCVLDNKEPYVTVESSHHVTAIVAAAHQSIDSGKPVKVEE